MEPNLFFHLVMKSTINRPNRDDDFCFTGTGIRTVMCNPEKTPRRDSREELPCPAGNRTWRRRYVTKAEKPDKV